jgi:elongation factor P--(R)-beta-lysine ligase
MSCGSAMSVKWHPSASIAMLHQRAELWSLIRAFFAQRGVLEVETPLLAQATAPEPMIVPFVTTYHGGGGERLLYLQSSPELHMKRLLAAGSGALFQIFRAFRNGESGRFHNPEFSLLEWYRPGFDATALMHETDELLHSVLGTPPAHYIGYTDIFQKHTGLHPLQSSITDLATAAATHGLMTPELGRDVYVDFLFSHRVQMHLGWEAPLFVYDYPASQAALARLNPRQPDYAERFELYVQGIELANGFHELNDVTEQRRRFEAELALRHHLKITPMPLDERFLAALEAGLPDCAGVAVGLDRLLMLKTKTHHIDAVLSFPLELA